MKTSASFGSPRALSRRAKGVIAALSAVVTLATGVCLASGPALAGSPVDGYRAAI